MPNGLTNGAYLKQLRDTAAANGLCYSCRARPMKLGRRRCQDCLDRVRTYRETNPNGIASEAKRMRASVARRRARRKAAGMCIYCGKAPPTSERVGCTSCLNRNADRSTRVRRLDGAQPRDGKCTACGAPDHTAQRHTRDIAPATPCET